MAGIEQLCVFCGSKHGRQVAYTNAARKLGRVLAERGIGLVYGGGDVGLMGEVANAVIEDGGEVIGVIPGFMVGAEVAHHGLTELRVVASMHERKEVMATLADGFVGLPGGWGTLEELFEMTTWGQLGLHHKPIGLLNAGDFFADLVSFLDHAVEQGFIKAPHRGLLAVDDDVDRLLDTLIARVPAAGPGLVDEELG